MTNRFQNAGPKPESAATDKGVLAVLRGAAQQVWRAENDADGKPDVSTGQCDDAIATVAELIEAASALRHTQPTYSIAYGQAEQRLDAALARCNGGAA